MIPQLALNIFIIQYFLHHRLFLKLLKLCTKLLGNQYESFLKLLAGKFDKHIFPKELTDEDWELHKQKNMTVSQKNIL